MRQSERQVEPITFQGCSRSKMTEVEGMVGLCVRVGKPGKKQGTAAPGIYYLAPSPNNHKKVTIARRAGNANTNTWD